ncbi:GATA-binding transcription factor [Tolypocladium capitatum]|uniref:GATA-binding transcription factor n=1 Tax=Tolypocladium capitatum TaxID=45235 RepID=A0A2K3Q2L7_9HYPO|nr:GATA-binding transcription factor [Tolypocladium capitatum]
MSIASLSPNHGLDSVPREAGASPRRDGGANPANGAQWTDADPSGRSSSQPLSTSGMRRLQPGDSFGFQMVRVLAALRAPGVDEVADLCLNEMRREADDAGFPLFISHSPNPQPATSEAHGKPDAAVTSATTTTAAASLPQYTHVATSKHGVHHATRNKQSSHHQRQHHHRQHKSDSPRKQRTGNARLECHVCGTSETPVWRCGPDGLGTLCNVCGLVLAKKQRRLSGV